LRLDSYPAESQDFSYTIAQMASNSPNQIIHIPEKNSITNSSDFKIPLHISKFKETRLEIEDGLNYGSVR